jgi:hypothetical protein
MRRSGTTAMRKTLHDLLLGAWTKLFADGGNGGGSDQWTIETPFVGLCTPDEGVEYRPHMGTEALFQERMPF